MNKIKQIVKSKFRTGLKSLPYIIIALLVGITAVYAGDLIPSGDQEGINTMHNLQDIYKLATGDGTSVINSTLTTSPELIGSGNTLNEVYDAVLALTEAPAAGGGVTKSGQALCWNTAGTAQSPCLAGGNTDGGQDGYYATTKGTALAYEDNGNATITDTVTGLMWKKCSEGKTGTTCATGSDTAETWTQALAVCEADTTASFTDWRLPNMRELTSLIDYGRTSPSINPLFSTGLGGILSGEYWSSTTYLDYPTYAWYVSFFDGSITYDVKATPYGYVRCVRG